MKNIVGVRFKKLGKIYFFNPKKWRLKKGDKVIVETAQGEEFGEVMIPNRMVPEDKIVEPLKIVIRIANKKDYKRYDECKALEKKAFELGGKDYNAPAQKVEDFLLNQKTSKFGKVKPTYLPGVTKANLNEILPDFVSETIKEAIPELDKKLHGFANTDAILTGVETRSSSPIQITREKETLNSTNVKGLYPCGEGAGYAGGIMTAAIDGIKCAIQVLEKE